MKKFRKIFAALLSITILGTTVPANLSLTASAAYVTTDGTIVVTQSEYDEYCSAWKNKGVSYLKINYNPSAKEKKMVKILQKILCNLGYDMPIDSIYGPKTAAAVRNLQQKSGYLAVDSCCGNATWNYILSKIVVEKAETKISFSSMVTPSVLNEGNSFNLGGSITSAGSKIWYVSGSVIDSTGRIVLAREDRVNAYSFNIRKSSINTYLKFGTLCEGNYTLCYTVTTTDGVKKEYTTSFTVTGKNAPINSAITEGMKQVKKDVDKYNGWSVFKEAWCADYVSSRYIRTYCGITSIKANANVGGLTANIVNSNGGTLYLYSEDHYNAVKKEANGGNVYKYAQFDKTGLKNTKLVSKTDVIPQHGDLILFRWSGSKTEISHIGIVDSMSDDLKNVNTIEGNTTFNGTKNSNYVNAGQRTYNNAYIIGIIRLN